jgi:hypothetical protein
MERFYTLRLDDLGKPTIRAFGKVWLVTNFMGRIFPGDMGKRVYRVATDAGDSYILQVENDEQRDKRLGLSP